MARDERSLRVYLVDHPGGRLSGYLMRKRSWLFDRPPPAAFGSSEEQVLMQLETQLQERLVRGEEDLDRYLWEERFATRRVKVAIHPATMVDKRPVVGRRELPLRISYAWTRTRSGAYRVVLPRFDWWILLEDLDTAGAALSAAVTGALLGSEPKGLYDFRNDGSERVRAHAPRFVRTAAKSESVDPAEAPPPTLSAVADDWIGAAARKKLPRVVGSPRLPGLFPLVQRWPRPSVLLVGEGGVGKTTEVQQLARALMRARREKASTAPRLWATSTERLLAGMVYVGMWQERALAVAEEAARLGDVIYVDRLLPLIRPQSSGSSLMDIFLPALRRGDLSLIAECTPTELSQARRLRPEAIDRFTQLHLSSPPLEEMLPLLEAYAARGERRFHARALRRLIQLQGAYRRDRSFPGKAFRFIDWARTAPELPTALDPAEVEKAFARRTGLPLEIISDARPASGATIADRLREEVIGQDAACAAAGRVLAAFKAGLNPPDRPVGTLLFVGPTGVGKTQLAKRIAAYLFGSADRLVRVDMSEYSVRGASARLLRTGRGVQSLATRVRREPLSVVLLDELEKAAGDTYDLMLGVLGEGRLTDDMGRPVDFRQALVLLTSNLGVRDRPPVGFDAERDAHDYARAVREHFRPELVGRIDQIVPFRSLGHADVRRIVDLELTKICAREGLLRRGITLEVPDTVRDQLADEGHDPTYGARPLRRVLEATLVTPLAVRLAREPTLRNVTFTATGDPDQPLTGPH